MIENINIYCHSYTKRDVSYKHFDWTCVNVIIINKSVSISKKRHGVFVLQRSVGKLCVLK